ncbi:hypothetical protein KQX54_017361 [Cotesia glomerata]|uniref:Uncharacterized protein n=1 Tax=Cotesia glomerata TaxID=32391 RepID=A0AAV7J1C6_COTGL|nr:hypothetical protein KQX54_017361 [Cotesia glomerata]
MPFSTCNNKTEISQKISKMKEFICKWLETVIQFLVRMYGYCFSIDGPAEFGINRSSTSRDIEVNMLSSKMSVEKRFLVYISLEIDILSFSDGKIYLQVVGSRNSILGVDVRMYGRLVTQ